MTENELSAMTVMQLRKLAKEQRITLGAGIDKSGIIRKILESISSPSESPDEPADSNESAVAEPRFQAAWHNTDAPRFNARPAYQAPGTASRPAWQNTTPSGHQLPQQPRVQPVRPGSFTPRFGPAAAAPAAAAESAPPARRETSSPAAGPLPLCALPRGRDVAGGFHGLFPGYPVPLDGCQYALDVCDPDFLSRVNPSAKADAGF